MFIEQPILFYKEEIDSSFILEKHPTDFNKKKVWWPHLWDFYYLFFSHWFQEAKVRRDTGLFDHVSSHEIRDSKHHVKYKRKYIRKKDIGFHLVHCIAGSPTLSFEKSRKWRIFKKYYEPIVLNEGECIIFTDDISFILNDDKTSIVLTHTVKCSL